MNTPAGPADVVEFHSVDVIVVESPACHFCADADGVLAEMADDFDLHIRRIDSRSADGAALLQEFGAAMTPLIIVDGEFLSAGRLPRGKLLKTLAARQTTAKAGAR